MAIVYRRKNEDIDSLLIRFKKECNKESIFKSIKDKQFYKSSKDIKLEKMLKNKRERGK